MNIKKINEDLYKKDPLYKPEGIVACPTNAFGGHFSEQQLNLKFATLDCFISKDKRLLDLGCGNGLHSIMLAPRVRSIVGVDFSQRFLDYADHLKKKDKIGNVSFVLSGFNSLNVKKSSIDVCFSFSAIYHYVDELGDLYSEIYRVLSPGGIAILDLGNSNSLNRIVCNHSECAKIASHTIGQHLREIEKGFDILERRSFQLLPMWSNRPLWLIPLNNKYLTRFLTINICGKMIDEWISSLPIVNRFAFRHLVVLRKK